MLPVRIVSLHVAVTIAELECLSAGDKLADDVVGRGYVAARIVAKVEHDAPGSSESGGKSVTELLRRGPTELGDPHIQDVVADHGRANRGDVDLRPSDGHREGCAAAADREDDL